MRIHTKVVINMTTLKIIHDESFEYHGEIAHCGGGGGGTSGAVSYPSHIEKLQQILSHSAIGDPVSGALATDWNTGTKGVDIVESIKTLQQMTNPYEGTYAYDPTGYITLAQTALDNFDSEVRSLDKETTYETLLEKAINIVDGNALVNSDYIDTAVEAYDRKTEKDHLNAITRFSFGMADINAINGSAYILGSALIESQRQDNLNSYRAMLSLDLSQRRLIMIDSAVRGMMGILQIKVNGLEADTVRSLDHGRVATILKTEEYEKNVEYDRADALWDVEALKYGMALLGAAGGGSVLPEKPSKTASAASGAIAGGLAGAKLGAKIGTMIGPEGTAIGAGIGALVGVIGGAYAGMQ